jgi:hypothetical protein
MLLNPAEAAIATSNLRDVETAARAMRLQIQVLNASTSREIDEAFVTIARERPDALFISSGPLFTSRRVQLAHLATRHAVPTIHGSRLYPEVGGLITYGASLTDAHHQAGIYSGRILKGEKPADMPVVQASKFELVINAQTARTLRLTVPPSLTGERVGLSNTCVKPLIRKQLREHFRGHRVGTRASCDAEDKPLGARSFLTEDCSPEQFSSRSGGAALYDGGQRRFAGTQEWQARVKYHRGDHQSARAQKRPLRCRKLWSLH